MPEGQEMRHDNKLNGLEFDMSFFFFIVCLVFSISHCIFSVVGCVALLLKGKR